MNKKRSNQLSDLADKLPNKIELTEERSREAAIVLGQINAMIPLLDAKYLSEALIKMKQQHDIKESASVIAYSVTTTFREYQNLEAAKIKQLELLLNLYYNAKQIIEGQIAIGKVLDSHKEIASLFGVR